MKIINFFSEVMNDEGKCLGGKGASLSRLYKQNIKVPKGFVVTIDTFDEFLRRIDLKKTIKTSSKNLQTLDSSDEIKKLSLRLKNRILAGERKAIGLLSKTIKKALNELDGEKFAVRSSATIEDGREVSFAGQFESRLNVKKEFVLDAVIACWISLYNERALWTGKTVGMYPEKWRMAVVVQEMVHADLSGVILTASPSNSDELLVELVEGYGENLVSGFVNPDQQFYVDKVTRNITRNKGKHLIDRDGLSRLLDVALLIEEIFGEPQDIEFAIKEGENYILQSRPEIRYGKPINNEDEKK